MPGMMISKVIQLILKSEERQNEIMSPIAFRLSAEQIRALALYLSVLH